MEWSSPLAAIQPSMFAHPWANRKDLPSSQSFFKGNYNFSVNNFNFRDLSMKKVPIDYFSVKPIRESSPAASLAADLSQNFHIDHRYACCIPLQASQFVGLADTIQSSSSNSTSLPLHINLCADFFCRWYVI